MIVDMGEASPNVVSIALGAVGGAAGTMIALRTRLALMQRDISENKRERVAMAEHLAARIDTLDKRQLALLRLTADIARKVNVDGRIFDDALVRMMLDETEPTEKGRR